MLETPSQDGQQSLRPLRPNGSDQVFLRTKLHRVRI